MHINNGKRKQKKKWKKKTEFDSVVFIERLFFIQYPEKTGGGPGSFFKFIVDPKSYFKLFIYLTFECVQRMLTTLSTRYWINSFLIIVCVSRSIFDFHKNFFPNYPARASISMEKTPSRIIDHKCFVWMNWELQ